MQLRIHHTTPVHERTQCDKLIGMMVSQYCCTHVSNFIHDPLVLDSTGTGTEGDKAPITPSRFHCLGFGLDQSTSVGFTECARQPLAKQARNSREREGSEDRKQRKEQEGPVEKPQLGGALRKILLIAMW